jgi:hypothetical protein
MHFLIIDLLVCAKITTERRNSQLRSDGFCVINTATTAETEKLLELV